MNGIHDALRLLDLLYQDIKNQPKGPQAGALFSIQRGAGYENLKGCADLVDEGFELLHQMGYLCTETVHEMRVFRSIRSKAKRRARR